MTLVGRALKIQHSLQVQPCTVVTRCPKASPECNECILSSHHSLFGNRNWRQIAPPTKNIDKSLNDATPHIFFPWHGLGDGKAGCLGSNMVSASLPLSMLSCGLAVSAQVVTRHPCPHPHNLLSPSTHNTQRSCITAEHVLNF